MCAAEDARLARVILVVCVAVGKDVEAPTPVKENERVFTVPRVAPRVGAWPPRHQRRNGRRRGPSGPPRWLSPVRVQPVQREDAVVAEDEQRAIWMERSSRVVASPDGKARKVPRAVDRVRSAKLEVATSAHVKEQEGVCAVVEENLWVRCRRGLPAQA